MASKSAPEDAPAEAPALPQKRPRPTEAAAAVGNQQKQIYQAPASEASSAVEVELSTAKTDVGESFIFELKSELELRCNPLPISKTLVSTLCKIDYEYQVSRVKGRVKWEVEGSTAGRTCAQLSLRGQNLHSQDPWKNSISLPLAEFATDQHAWSEEKSFEIPAKGELLDLSGKQGHCLLPFCSLFGPKGAKFKIKELQIKVFIEDVQKSTTVELKCGAKKMKANPYEPFKWLTLTHADFRIKKHVLDSIKGHVKWRKGTSGTARLKLQFYHKNEGDEDIPDAALVLGECPSDPSNDGYTTSRFDLRYEKYKNSTKHSGVFAPRQPGSSVVVQVELRDGAELLIAELDIKIIATPLKCQKLTHKVRAFVVGICKYSNPFSELRYPRNDALTIIKALMDHGVDEKDIVSVYKEKDCHIFRLQEEFDRFVEICQPGDFAFLFYAGHGCAFGNEQCLIARELSLQEKFIYSKGMKQTIENSSLQVETMLAQLREKGIDRHLVLLDCCREIIEKNVLRGGVKQDLKPAPFNISLGPGTTIGYATAPDDMAYERNEATSSTVGGGTGAEPYKPHDRPDKILNGYYTTALAKHLGKMRTDVDYMLRLVAKDVYEMSGKKQMPYRSSCQNEPDAYLFA